MGDKAYRYPVALRWDQGAEELIKLKNKLLLYFQSAKSNGGDCDIPETNCSQGYILIYFKEKKAQKGVLKKNPHQIPIKDKPPLSLDAFLPNAADTRDMGGAVSSLVGLADDGASESPADADHQQENNQSSDNRKRNISLTTNPDPGNGSSKRLGDLVQWDEWESGVGGNDGTEDNSSAPKPLTENYGYNNENPGTPRNGSRNDSLRRQSSKEESGKNRHAAHSKGDGEAWSLVDADGQQGNYQNTDNWERSPSLPDHGSMDGDSTRQDINSSAARPLKESGKSKRHEDSFTPGNEFRRTPLRQPMSTEEPGKNRSAAPPEIFMSVTAKLDKKWITDNLVEEIKAEIPSLSVNHGSDYVEVTGKFAEIKLVDCYFKGKLKIDAEKPPETSSDWSPTDSQEDQVCFPSALYEYIMEIYRAEIDNMERRYGVKIAHRSIPEGSTYVRFIPQGSESSPEKAKEKFTDKVQKVMDDWSQETVDPSVVPLTLPDIKERVKAKWSNTLVMQGESMGIVLRGPRDELSQVKKFLEKADHKPPRPRTSVTISTSNMKTDIEVDARHMDILKKLKPRQISDIEKKYNVKMEEHKKNGSLLVVTFKSMKAPPDLSPHASHSFITLLQKTFFNIQKKEISVKPEFQEERVSIVQEQLMMAGIDVVMEYSTGTVLLIGHPLHVDFAVEKLDDRQNPGTGQTGPTSQDKTDSKSSSAATQKAEEPDTCPICLNEMEDKVTLKCKHAYCKECLERATAHKPVCAICGIPYGKVIGDQPDGTMRVTTNTYQLPGYPSCGTIEINYSIPSGTQKENHPRPGRPFYGASRTAYLPDNKEGRDILRLLKKAFDQKLIFTVGDSRTTGATDTVTWNDVHHKTSTSGGPQCFGYPDANYLSRVRDELKAKGVE